jgi:hypothetical protein
MAAGLASLGVAIGLALIGEPTFVGDRLTRMTVRCSLTWYALATSMMLFLGRDDWRADAWRGWLARWCWTWGWVAYVVHLGMAFHWFHGWSHARAMEHVRMASGVGEGIYVSHLFTLWWTADLAWWWLAPGAYAERSRWFDGLLHGFMLFMVFNGTIVYETGFIRGAGIGLFALLSLLMALRVAGLKVAPKRLN